MARDRSYKYGWHPDRPWDSHRFPRAARDGLTAEEAAEYVGLSARDDIYACIKAGWVDARRGRGWRIDLVEADALRALLIEKGAFCNDPAPDHSCDVSVSVVTATERQAIERVTGRPMTAVAAVIACSSRPDKRVVKRLEREDGTEEITYADGHIAIAVPTKVAGIRHLRPS